MVVSLLT